MGVQVDNKIPDLISRTSAHTGKLADDALRSEIRWLLQTFSARSPGSISRVERGMPEWVETNRAAIERMLQRANTESARQQLRTFLDPRMPAVAARAGVAAFATATAPRAGWLDGDIHLLHAGPLAEVLRSIGAGEFVTFEDPVLECETSPFGLTATFALSADVLVLVVEPGAELSIDDCVGAIGQHMLNCPSYRQNLICRTRASGRLLDAAGELLPWQDPNL